MRWFSMRKSLILRWLIAYLVTIGLSSAPFTSSIAVNATIHGVVSTMQAQDMSEGMPCCPDQEKDRGCASCPLSALCVLTLSLPASPDGEAVSLRVAARTSHLMPDDLVLDGLGQEPPDHPPRTIL